MMLTAPVSTPTSHCLFLGRHRRLTAPLSIPTSHYLFLGRLKRLTVPLKTPTFHCLFLGRLKSLTPPPRTPLAHSRHRKDLRWAWLPTSSSIQSTARVVSLVPPSSRHPSPPMTTTTTTKTTAAKGSPSPRTRLSDTCNSSVFVMGSSTAGASKTAAIQIHPGSPQRDAHSGILSGSFSTPTVSTRTRIHGIPCLGVRRRCTSTRRTHPRATTLTSAPSRIGTACTPPSLSADPHLTGPSTLLLQDQLFLTTVVIPQAGTRGPAPPPGRVYGADTALPVSPSWTKTQESG